MALLDRVVVAVGGECRGPESSIGAEERFKTQEDQVRRIIYL